MEASFSEVLRLSIVFDRRRRRATERAVERRRLDAGAHYVYLQVMRLTKALRVVDLNLERGDLKAVEPMLKVMAQLDKYHAPSAPAPAPPPLALAAPSGIETGTENGAQAVEIPQGETRMRFS